MATAAPSIIKAGSTLTVYFPGRIYTAESTVRNWEVILQAIKDKDWTKLREQLDLSLLISNSTGGRAEVIGDQVFLDGLPVRNIVTERILNMLLEGWDASPALKFLENVNANPASWAIEELYLFLETNHLPITDDGCFLAYKVVTNDYKDCYTQSVDNSVGQIVKMDRLEVDPVRDRTCSNGLHFCSEGYIGTFSGWYGGQKDTRLMVLKINPKDVVSIPSDYNNTKGRCCLYEVIDEIGIGAQKEHIKDCPAVVCAKEICQKSTDRVEELVLYAIGEVGLHFDGNLNDTFRLLRGDELDFTEFIMVLEEKLNLDLHCFDEQDTEDYWMTQSIGSIIKMIHEVLQKDKEESKTDSVNLYKLFDLPNNPAGYVLKSLRESLGITGSRLAKHLDVSRSSVWSWENSMNPKTETVDRALLGLYELTKDN